MNIHFFILLLFSSICINLDASGLKNIVTQDLVEYYKNLDNIIKSVKEPNGSFNLHFHERSFLIAMNTLTTEKLIEILRENNPKVMDIVLKNGIKYITNMGEKISFERIVNQLLHLLPLDAFLSSQLEDFDFYTLVGLVLEKLENETLENLFGLMSKLPLKFWSDLMVRSNKNLFYNLSGFHFGNTKRFVSSAGETTKYVAPFENVASILFTPDTLRTLNSSFGITWKRYTDVKNELTRLHFILQTFIHEHLFQPDPSVFGVIVGVYDKIKDALDYRSENFPAESRYLYMLQISFNKCYSHRIYESRNDDVINDFFLIDVEYAGIRGTLQSLYPENPSIAYDDVDPNVLLMIYMMNAVNDLSVADADLPGLIDYLAWDIENVGRVVKPFANNSRIIVSFAQTILRTFEVSSKLETAFCSSRFVRQEDAAFMTNIVRNNFSFLEYLNECKTLEFSSVFANAFASQNGSPIPSIPVGKTGRKRHIMVIGEENRIQERNTDIPFSLFHPLKRTIEHVHRHSDRIVASTPDLDPFRNLSKLNDVEKSALFDELNAEIPEISDSSVESISDPYDSVSSPCSEPSVVSTPPHGNRKRVRRSPPQLISSLADRQITMSPSDVAIRTHPFTRKPQINFGGAEKEFQLADISPSIVFPPEDEYIYVNYLMRPNTPESEASDTIPEELKFIHGVMNSIGESIRDVKVSIRIKIEGSQTQGCGLLKQSFTDFGKIISSPRMKTVKFMTGETVSGYVPVPFLCPKVMGFLGAWNALSLRYEFPLAWNFAPMYHNFLFDKNRSDAGADELIELIYADLFEMVRGIYSLEDSTYRDLLPRIFKPHRMFNLPYPMDVPAEPFMLELRFLELFARQENALAYSRRPASLGRGAEFYLGHLKSALKRNMIAGRDEFQKYFNHFFKSEFIQKVQPVLFDRFITRREAIPADVIKRLKYVGNREVPVLILNDLPDPSPVAYFTPEELMQVLISKMDTKTLEQFLQFVTGSTSLAQDGKMISFNVCDSSVYETHSRSHVCVNSFILVLHRRSAQATYDMLLESIRGSCGFAKDEIRK